MYAHELIISWFNVYFEKKSLQCLHYLCPFSERLYCYPDILPLATLLIFVTLQNLTGKNKKSHCYHQSFPMALKYPVGYQYFFYGGDAAVFGSACLQIKNSQKMK
jgi:hypothetical protein